MPFEPLTHQTSLVLEDYPERWYPLLHCYDPDLPLFPIYYFHRLRSDIPRGNRPTEGDRVYGYIAKANVLPLNRLEVTVVTNKDIGAPENGAYRMSVIGEIKERLGIAQAVTERDLENVFQGAWEDRNRLLQEVWYRVVPTAYGGTLPFGRFWDEVLGLARFAASFYTAGRKDELIQTHYFASKFGERIQSSGNLPQVGFFLVPTFREFADLTNSLSIFPQFESLVQAASDFRARFCAPYRVGGLNLSRVNTLAVRIHQPRPRAIKQDDAGRMIGVLNRRSQPALQECFNSFGKHGNRWIRFLLMLHDVRHGLLNPATLTSEQIGRLYDETERDGGTYITPKVIAIYAQQCFANPSALPVDTWVETFLKWPLDILPRNAQRAGVLAGGRNLGRVERLIWTAGQARKVHSSACDDALWCLKKAPEDREARGANPLACTACRRAIRNVCPAYATIREQMVALNTPNAVAPFHVVTSSRNNQSPNQSFVECMGNGRFGTTIDRETPRDSPQRFQRFPVSDQQPNLMTVEQFITSHEV